ncbi:MAG TPA: hypothetical protein VNL73_04490 [Verrucomicrobiae bacterium]|nr:hypothetical protein [Verrucomicrobiae bacterium]
MPGKPLNVVSRHILEIRFKPSTKILDYRGAWTEYLSQEMELPQWKIDQNRIDLTNLENNELAFLSYKNCGYVIEHPNSTNLFQDRAAKFLRTIQLIEDFKLPAVTRLGVRSVFYKMYPDSFEALFRKFKQKLINTESETIAAYGGNIADVGVALNLESTDGKFNTNSGPMNSSQAANYFPNIELPLNAGYFFEIDFFKENIGNAETDALCSLLKSFAEQSWGKMETLSKTIFE